MVQWVEDLAFSVRWLGSLLCGGKGVGLVPGLGISMCYGHGQKKSKNKNQTNKNKQNKTKANRKKKKLAEFSNNPYLSKFIVLILLNILRALGLLSASWNSLFCVPFSVHDAHSFCSAHQKPKWLPLTTSVFHAFTSTSSGNLVIFISSLSMAHPGPACCIITSHLVCWCCLWNTSPHLLLSYSISSPHSFQRHLSEDDRPSKWNC